MNEQSSHPSRPEEDRPVTRVSLVFESFRHFLDEYSSHISMGGMFIGARRPLPPGSLCQLEFRLRDGYPLLLGRGEVVWTRAREEGPGRPPGMGVRFRDLEGSSRDLVFAIVEHRLAEGDSLFELEPGVDPESPEALDRMLKEAERRRERAEADARSPEAGATQRLSSADLVTRLSEAEQAAGAAVAEGARTGAPPGDVLPSIDLPADPAESLPRVTTTPRAPAPVTGQASLPGLDEEALLAHPVDAGAGEPEDDEPTVVDRQWIVEPGPHASALPDAVRADTREPVPAPDPEVSPEAETELEPEDEIELEVDLDEEPSEEPDEELRYEPSVDDEIARSAGSVLGELEPETPAADPRAFSGGGEPEPVDLDELFSVAPPDEPLAIEGAPRRDRRLRRQQKRTWLGLAVALVLLAGAAFFLVRAAGWWPPAEVPAVLSAEPPAASGETPGTTAASEAEVPVAAQQAAGPERIDVGAPDASGTAEPPSAAEASKAPEPVAAPVPSAQPTPPPPPAATPAPAGRAARAVQDIAWQRASGGTRLTLTFDGELTSDRVSSQRLGSGTPRQLLRLRGITEAYRPPNLQVGTAELLRVRTGRHLRDGVEELHVVLDLGGPDVVVTGVETHGRRLEIDLAVP